MQKLFPPFMQQEFVLIPVLSIYTEKNFYIILNIRWEL